MTRIIWSPRSVRDLESIRDFVAQGSPLYAGLVIQRIVSGVERLSDFPRSGRVVPELEREEIRELVQPPFRIVYRVGGESVEIATVFRSSRMLPGGLE